MMPDRHRRWAILLKVIGVSAVSAGNLILLMSIGIIVGSPVFGWFSDVAFNSRKGYDRRQLF